MALNSKELEHYRAILAKAHAAGMAAGAGSKPVPMIVGQAKDLLSNEIDYSKPTEYIADGVCGLAWVNIRPGTHKFAKFLKQEPRTDLGRPDLAWARTDFYYRGVSTWIGEFQQSLQRKEAYAHAFAKVLNEEVPGIEACAMSRMD